MNETHRSARCLGFAAVGLALVTTVAACGGTKSAAGTPSASGSPTATGNLGGGRQIIPGTFGIAAAVAPGRIEVQDPTTGQTTITYTATTAFTQQETVTEAAVTSGECISAVQAIASTGSSATPTAPRSSTAPGTPISIIATAITITQPLSGSCTPAGGRGGGFGGASGRPTSRPSNFPTGASTGGAGGRGGFGGLVSGEVTSVTGATIDVQTTDRQTQQVINDTVTVTSSTRYLKTVSATSSAVRIGLCVQATGPSDSTGAVAASRIALSAAVNGACVNGLGGRGGFGFPRGGQSAVTSG